MDPGLIYAFFPAWYPAVQLSEASRDVGATVRMQGGLSAPHLPIMDKSPAGVSKRSSCITDRSRLRRLFSWAPAPPPRYKRSDLGLEAELASLRCAGPPTSSSASAPLLTGLVAGGGQSRSRTAENSDSRAQRATCSARRRACAADRYRSAVSLTAALPSEVLQLAPSGRPSTGTLHNCLRWGCAPNYRPSYNQRLRLNLSRSYGGGGGGRARVLVRSRTGVRGAEDSTSGLGVGSGLGSGSVWVGG